MCLGSHHKFSAHSVHLGYVENFDLRRLSPSNYVFGTRFLRGRVAVIRPYAWLRMFWRAGAHTDGLNIERSISTETPR